MKIKKFVTVALAFLFGFLLSGCGAIMDYLWSFNR